VGQKGDGTSAGIFIYHPESGDYERLTSGGRNPNLLADGRRLLYEDGGALRFLDTASGRSAEILSLSPARSLHERHFRLSRDDRQIVFQRTESEADIWLMSLE
jgi:hypothetical protein